jgi:Holliday junction resolvasome RuvABC endonuclease subunit
MTRRVMGLDASTSVIGICILDYEDGYKPILIHSEFYRPDKTNGLLEMLVKARNYIIKLFGKYNVQEFVIEDYIRFMKNKSSASTVIPLSILNMTLRLAILDLGIIPQALNVLKIRHTIKLTKILPKKEEIPELVAQHFGIPYPWLYKINKRTKQQQIMESSYDVADAMAVSLAWAKLKTTPKKKSRTKAVKDAKSK